MRIVEIFHSRQGEGRWTGTPSVFVRTGGCNLACWFCDTPYAASGSGEGIDLVPEEILGRVLLFDCPHVVLTGGEPMLHAELVPLTRLLRQYDKTITIETAGTRDLNVCCDLMSISPKLAGSGPRDAASPEGKRHESARSRPEVVRSFLRRFDYQFKFVVDTPADIAEVEHYWNDFPEVPPNKIFLMPQGTDPDTLRPKETWIKAACERTGFHFCPRMQIEWYGDTRKT